MQIKVDVKGLDSILEVFKTLPDHISLKLIGSTLRKVAGKTLVKPLRQALPYSKETVKGIRIRGSREANRIFIGAVRDVYKLRFLEKGTKPRTSKGGATWSGISPRPIIEPVIDRQVPTVIDNVNNEFANEMNKFILRRIKKINK